MKKRIKRYSESRLYDENYKEIVRRYGKKRADMANIGWYGEDRSVSSKVYGNPCMILTTYWDGKTETYQHDEEEY